MKTNQTIQKIYKEVFTKISVFIYDGDEWNFVFWCFCQIPLEKNESMFVSLICMNWYIKFFRFYCSMSLNWILYTHYG